MSTTRTTRTPRKTAKSTRSAKTAARSGQSIDVPKMQPSRTVLLLVDFINPLDFPGADALAAPAVAAAEAAARLKTQLTKEGAVSVYANDNYGSWDSDFGAIWRRCRAQGGAAGKMARLLKPAAGDCTILKPRHSAFYSTALDLLLRQLRCKRVVLAGLAADSCVLFSAMDAYLRGYAVWVPEDCVASESEAAKMQALDHMKRILKAATRSSSAPDAADRRGAGGTRRTGA